MRDLTDPCPKCGSVDRYFKGNFSYCRPCHAEAQKRYLENKRLGITAETKGGPNRSLDEIINNPALKARCKNNHLLSGDNVRYDTQRGNILFRRCRACERNAKRVSYGLAPEPDAVRLSELLDNQDNTW